ncbi:hypothetical protein HY008_02435 [Candidatus Woesebacteria bacterium]|nr:hypothetical protein [Candidatus Woesebacteria bacterium]
MFRRLGFAAAGLSFATGVLITSIIQTSSIKYNFPPTQVAAYHEEMEKPEKKIEVDYFLAYPGRIHPDSPLWRLKALRDRIWLLITFDKNKKAELKLLFADKRLGLANILFENGKPEIGLSTLTKGEKYLEEAFDLGRENSEFIVKLAKASLKHREVIEKLLAIAPEEARPEIVKTLNYPKSVYDKTRNKLMEFGKPVPENPFESH